jgi:hypothetical protein
VLLWGNEKQGRKQQIENGGAKMTTSQDQIIVEHGKTDFNAVIDAKKPLPLVRSTIETEPLAHSITDYNDFTQKTRGTPKSDRVNTKCRQNDNVENHELIIADYKNANLDRRLQMYLQFPFLKSKFDLINRNDLSLKTFSDFELRIKSFATQMGMALGSAGGCGAAVP